MNPKLPLNGRIYILTAGRVLNINVQSRPAFVQSQSQSQPRLMFVTALENGHAAPTCKLRILVKAQPALVAPGHSHQLGLAYGCEI